MHVDMQEIQAFFFEAMLQGWVNPNAHAEPIPGMPGYKGYEYHKNGLYLRDAFIANRETGKSAGSTTILQDDVPVWVMYYGGMYPQEVIPFLKQVLTHAYQSRTFKGGRGATTTEPTNDTQLLVYHNVLLPHCNEFTRFQGSESVYNSGNLGERAYHDYWGMSLV